MRFLVGAFFFIALVSSTIVVTVGDIVSRSPSDTNEGVVSEDAPIITGESIEQIIGSNAHSAVRENIEERLKKISSSSDLQEILEEKFALEAGLTLFPANVTSLKSAIESEDTSPRARLALIHSLGTATSAEGEAAVAAMAIDEALPAHLRIQAITTLAERELPSKNTIATLSALSEGGETVTEEVRNAATLNLGALAFATLRSDRGSSDEITRSLLRRAQAQHAQSSDFVSQEFSLTVDALANSGNPLALPFLRSLTESHDPSTRALGASALRAMPGSESEERLLHLVQEDPSEETRQSAVEAIAQRKPSPSLTDKIAILVTQEGSAIVRREMIRLLSTRVSNSEKARESLEALLTTESDEQNYELLVTSLNS